MLARILVIVAIFGCHKPDHEQHAGSGNGSAVVPAEAAVPIDAVAVDAAEAPPPIDAAAAPPPVDAGTASGLPAQGKPCKDGACAKGLTCVEYYGIAGPRGPKFTSCEIPCTGGKTCPKPQHCITIADGPGQVCRP